MANQNPQPAMLSQRFNITAVAGPPVVPANGATFTGTILTQQAYNELIYIYGVQFQALTAHLLKIKFVDLIFYPAFSPTQINYSLSQSC